MPRFVVYGDVEKKTLAILRVLSEAGRSLGARAISQRLKGYGIHLTERAVRYHLKLMDERGWTRLVGQRDGRVITEEGMKELEHARVKDKVGFVLTKIEALSFMTDFSPKERKGLIPVNLSIVSRQDLPEALEAMALAFKAGICVSKRIKIIPGGEKVGNVVIPDERVGVATVCSIVINGVLLKAGVPMDSRFGGILEIRGGKPQRFVELIHYAGSSLDPSEAFIRAGMTSVREVARKGSGKVLANFREVPAVCKGVVEETLSQLKQAGIGGVVSLGGIGEDVCEVPVEIGKMGMVLLGGLNPLACVQEMGINAENMAMSSVLPYEEMEPFEEVYGKICG